ncbi:IS110 family transposase [Pseudomonas aeruginosa]|uniref:IS110 family transposase n=1 Tax=Pseudomonas aeruginosa TaxID=287 RepID=UPI00053D420A|nr:IS110 family transposase [Pseudomonas aeruginosa]
MNCVATVIGLDISKSVFVAVGRDDQGREAFRKKLSRHQVLAFFARATPAKVGIEACAGAHHWARALADQGHDVRLIAGQHVKAYLSGNKNDANDAAAIAEARSRAMTKYVPVNTEAQQDLQMMHRVRQSLIERRTAVINQARGLLGEYGIVIAIGARTLRRELTAILTSDVHDLSAVALNTFQDLSQQLDELEGRITRYDERIAQAARADERAQRLMEVPGIGVLTATALLASLNNALHFTSGRHFAANIGLVPHEHSTGGRQRLFGISKRGDRYLRMLLIHGARSALQWAHRRTDRILRWAADLQQRKGTNVATVALANKLARIVWALLAHGRRYESAHISSMTTH